MQQTSYIAYVLVIKGSPLNQLKLCSTHLHCKFILPFPFESQYFHHPSKHTWGEDQIHIVCNRKTNQIPYPYSHRKYIHVLCLVFRTYKLMFSMKFVFHFLWPPLCLFLKLLLQLLSMFLGEGKSICPVSCQVHPSFLNSGPATGTNCYSCRNPLNFELPHQDLFPYVAKWKGYQGISELNLSKVGHGRLR